jgi:hypothetical protein
MHGHYKSIKLHLFTSKYLSTCTLYGNTIGHYVATNISYCHENAKYKTVNNLLDRAVLIE